MWAAIALAWGVSRTLYGAHAVIRFQYAFAAGGDTQRSTIVVVAAVGPTAGGIAVASASCTSNAIGGAGAWLLMLACTDWAAVSFVVDHVANQARSASGVWYQAAVDGYNGAVGFAAIAIALVAVVALFIAVHALIAAGAGWRAVEAGCIGFRCSIV